MLFALGRGSVREHDAADHVDAQGEHADGGGGDSVRAEVRRHRERRPLREDVRLWMVRGSERVFERERDEWTV